MSYIFYFSNEEFFYREYNLFLNLSKFLLCSLTYDSERIYLFNGFLLLRGAKTDLFGLKEFDCFLTLV